MNYRSGAAASGPWRVAVGGNRVQNMTPEQIGHAFRAGQLNERTPLWPPGNSGWQALGTFEQFRSQPGIAPQHSANLASYDEDEDDPTRMWTGGDDPSMMMDMPQASAPAPRAPVQPAPRPPQSMPPQSMPSQSMPPQSMPRQAHMPQPMPPAPLAPPQRPAAPSPSHSASPQQPVGAPMAQPISAAQRAAVPIPALGQAATPRPSTANVAFRAPEPRRSGGVSLVVGLVGFIALGVAVFAARGDWGALFGGSAKSASAAAPKPEPPKPETEKPEPPKAEAEKPEAPAGNTQLAKAEVRSATSVADLPESKEANEGQAPAKKAEGGETAASKKAAVEKAEANEDEDEDEEKSAKAEVAKPKRSAVSSSRKSRTKSRAAKRRARRQAKSRARAPVAKSEPRDEAPSSTSSQKREPAPLASKQVEQNAAKALARSATFAQSCQPARGPSGSGKVRVVYDPSGSVKSVEILTARFRGTLTGSCVRQVFRRAKIPAFDGRAPTFIKTFNIPG